MAESDDREFEALLADHADVRAAYRAASADAQPAEPLDAAILAASRRAVNAGPGRAGRPRSFASRMAVPLSAAAVMVLATSLSFLVYEERGTPSAPEPSRAARAPASEASMPRDADTGVGAPAPAAPDAKAVESTRQAATTEVPAKARPHAAPMSGNTATSVPAPGQPAAAPPPPAKAPSEVTAEVSAPRAAMQGALEEYETTAAAKRSAEAASERASARNETREAVRQAESARAIPPGPVADQAARTAPSTLREERADERVGSAEPAAPVTSTGPAGVSAKRLASPLRESAADSLPGATALPKAAAVTEESPAAWIARVRALVDAGRIEAARTEVARLRCRYPDLALPTDLPAPRAGVTCQAPAAKEGSPDLR